MKINFARIDTPVRSYRMRPVYSRCSVTLSGQPEDLANGYMTEPRPAIEKHGVRSHRCLNRKVKEKRKRTDTSPVRTNDYVPTREDVERFDPVVLTDRKMLKGSTLLCSLIAKLSQDQTSKCRLPDCFATAPQIPIDVSDRVIGTHQ